MTVRLNDAAYRMCQSADWNLSPLALQKMLYLAHMQHLGETGGSPLINEAFEAWDYGPVIPELYQNVKMFGRGKVRDIFFGVNDISGTKEAADIDYMANTLKAARPGALVEFTHHKDGAWAKNYIPGARGRIIPNADIIDEYRWRPKD